MMKLSLSAAALAAAVLLPGAAFADKMTENPQPKSDAVKLSHGDSKFFKQAAIGGMTEIETGKLAQSQAADPAVRDFAKQMVDDHPAADSKLKELASRKGVTLPTALDKDHQDAVDSLKK